MRVCIYGAGAVGCFLGTMFGIGGCRISAIARGRTLKSLQQHGMRLIYKDDVISTAVRVSSNPVDIGVQDIVVIAVKGMSLLDIASNISPLLSNDTIIVTAMNGIPWWFFVDYGGEYKGSIISTIDRNNIIQNNIPYHSIIGSVIFPNCETVEPGFSKHNFGDKVIIGEPSRCESGRIRVIEDILANAGLDIVVSSNIYNDIWNKAVGNITMNPLSAVTGSDCNSILTDNHLLEYAKSIMGEAIILGKEVGCTSLFSVDEQIKFTLGMGKFTTSMLQDVIAGNQLEIDQLIAVMSEIGKKTGVATPYINSLLGLVSVFGREHGLYGLN